MPDELPPQSGDASKSHATGWTAALASLCFFGLSVFLLRAYGLLHWGIIRQHYRALEEPLKGKLFSLLGMLEIYHVTALLSVGFGVRTFWTQPRWVRLALFPVSLASLGIVFTLM
jgi:hypothetical protein